MQITLCQGLPSKQILSQCESVRFKINPALRRRSLKIPFKIPAEYPEFLKI